MSDLRILFIFRISILTFVGIALSTQVALAAAGGGVDGGGGGGKMVPGAHEDGSTLTKIFEEGVAFLTDGECKRAEKKFERILEKVPRSSQVNYLRGVSLQCMQRYKSSIRYFRRAKRDDAEFFRAYGGLGISYLAIERPKRAGDELKELTEFKRLCDRPRRKCPVDLLKAHKELETAIQRAEGGTDFDTDSDTDSDVDKKEGQHGLLFDRDVDPQTSYLAVVSLINAEKFPEAMDELRALSTRLGPHPDVLNSLGYASRRLGHFARAENYYMQALAIDPLHRGANEYLGEMWVQLGRADEAKVRLAVLEEACPFGCVEYEDLKRMIESRVVAAH